MLRKIHKALKSIPVSRPFKNMVVGVSGGADSMALLYALHELSCVPGCRLVAAHLNHLTRGAESDADASFVRKACRKLGVKCIVKKVDVPQLSRRRRISIEMAAREARYGFFLEIARKLKNAAVVTAHTADDQAETVILKLVRGAGLRGLGGISGFSMMEDIPVLRPMLSVSRSEVVKFLEGRRLEWREDRSNDSAEYMRNRVRHQILPLLERDFNPDIKSVLGRTAEVVRQDNELLDGLAGAVLAGCRRGPAELDLAGLKRENRAIVSRVLILWLAGAGIEAENIDVGLISAVTRLINGRKANACIGISGGFELTREYDRLILRGSADVKSCAEAFRYVLNIPGRIEIASAGVAVEADYCGEIVRERGRPGHYPVRATVSRKAVGRKKITVRSWQEGDRIRPMGMKGTRKLKDIFIDLKIPVGLRRQIPVFECGGEVIWLPGYRVARGWEVGQGKESVLLKVS